MSFGEGVTERGEDPRLLWPGGRAHGKEGEEIELSQRASLRAYDTPWAPERGV